MSPPKASPYSNLVGLDAHGGQLLLQGVAALHHHCPRLGQPAVEGVGVPGELLPQLVILLMAHLLLARSATLGLMMH